MYKIPGEGAVGGVAVEADVPEDQQDLAGAPFLPAMLEQVSVVKTETEIQQQASSDSSSVPTWAWPPCSTGYASTSTSSSVTAQVGKHWFNKKETAFVFLRVFFKNFYAPILNFSSSSDMPLSHPWMSPPKNLHLVPLSREGHHTEIHHTLQRWSFSWSFHILQITSRLWKGCRLWGKLACSVMSPSWQRTWRCTSIASELWGVVLSCAGACSQDGSGSVLPLLLCHVHWLHWAREQQGDTARTRSRGTSNTCRLCLHFFSWGGSQNMKEKHCIFSEKSFRCFTKCEILGDWGECAEPAPRCQPPPAWRC